MSVEELKQTLNTSVDIKALEKALMHSSYIRTNEEIEDKLQTVNKIKSSIGGDIIVFVAELYYLFETSKSLVDIMGAISKEIIVSTFYDEYDIGSLVKLSKGEEESGTIKYTEQVNILIYEIYVKDGYRAVYNLLRDSIKNSEVLDYKTLLQIHVQKYGQSVIYETIDSNQHPNPSFTIRLSALGKSVIASDSSKKGAEKKAAEKYCKGNNVKLYAKKSDEIGKLRTKQTWQVSIKRKKEIEVFANKLNIPNNFIVYNVFDAVLTHISYYNKNNKLGDSNKILTFIGSQIFSIEVQRALLIKYFDFEKSNHKEFGMLKGEILKNGNVKGKIEEKYNDIFLKYLNISTRNSISDVSISETYKATLGALVYINFKGKNMIEVNFQDYILNMIDELNLIEIDTNSYINWLIDFQQNMEVDVATLDYKEIGKSNEKTFNSLLSLQLDAYNLENIKASAQEKSKIKIRESIAQKFHIQLKKEYDITNNFVSIPDNPNINLFLSKLIDYTLKLTSFNKIKLNMMGGLVLNDWNEKKAQLICEQLINRGLYAQLCGITKRWVMEYGAEIVGKLGHKFNDLLITSFNIKNSEDGFNEIDGVEKNIIISSDKKFIKEVSINKKRFYVMLYNSCEIKVRLYKFILNTCPICGNELDNELDNIFVENRYTKKSLVITSEVSKCDICNISGVQKDQMKNIDSLGFDFYTYTGSPSYYKSSIINLNNIEVNLVNILREKTHYRNVTTPEQLEKKLQTMKEIGLAGERIIFDYEKNKLIALGLKNLSDKVEWVSQYDCKAGYDILSFDEQGNHKYIEVKSSTSNSEKFYLSNNEIDISEKLQDQYFIYKVNNLKSMPFITKIKNPAKLLKLGTLKAEPTQFSVTFGD